jgi:hypothetical protein
MSFDKSGINMKSNATGLCVHLILKGPGPCMRRAISDARCSCASVGESWKTGAEPMTRVARFFII